MQIRNAKYEDLKQMCNLWNEVVSEEYFLKPFTQEEYDSKDMTGNVLAPYHCGVIFE